MSQAIKLAVIPGDGIGPEVIAEALKVFDSVTADSTVRFDRTTFSLGVDRYFETGEILTASDLAEIHGHDVILLGAVGGVPGDPRLTGVSVERDLLLALRFELDQCVNLRPAKIFPGAPGPLHQSDNVDFVVVREGTEGAYSGNGGRVRPGSTHEIANELSVHTHFGVARVARYAFALAESRDKRLTWVAKTNVLVHAGALWQRVVEEIALEYPEVTVEYLHVDAATIHMVTNPSRFDVIVTDNLFGDILTDLAAAISGGIGVAASGNINTSGSAPSMFEPVHGSAPDIAGTQQADPTAAILSVAMLLEHLHLTAEAERVERAVRADIANRAQHPRRSTAEIGDAIAALL